MTIPLFDDGELLDGMPSRRVESRSRTALRQTGDLSLKALLGSFVTLAGNPENDRYMK